LHIVAHYVRQNINLLTESSELNFAKISVHSLYALVVKVTWEISPMSGFEWYWLDQCRLSCRHDIRANIRMNLPQILQQNLWLVFWLSTMGIVFHSTTIYLGQLLLSRRTLRAIGRLTSPFADPDLRWGYWKCNSRCTGDPQIRIGGPKSPDPRVYLPESRILTE
jgi:hypothetical protein